MYMTDEEIRRDYREAKDKKKQIGILADMNATSKREIKEKLTELGRSSRHAALRLPKRTRIATSLRLSQ